MYSLIIAEDEYITRRNLVERVPWNELGFRVDAQFADGADVLAYLNNNMPDVILTDIKMSKVNGTEVARFIAEHKLPIKVVFLSGYRDFSYAQEAVEYQVQHYILKPVVIQKLKEAFLSLKAKMDEQRIRELRVVDEYERLVNHEKQQFVIDSFFGVLHNQEKMEKRLSLLGSSSKDERVFFVKILIHRDQKYKDFTDAYGEIGSWDQITKSLSDMDSDFEFYPITKGDQGNGNSYIIGVLWENGNRSEKVISREFIQKSMEEWLSLSIKLPFFYPMSSPGELVECAERYRKNENMGEFTRGEIHLKLIKEQNTLLASFLVQNDCEGALDVADSLVQNLVRGGLVFAQRQCLYTVIRLLEEIKNLDEVAWSQTYMECMDQNVLAITEASLLSDWLKRCVELIFGYLSEKRNQGREARIDAIMNYIRLHFTEDISLDTIAENVFLNPSYVSRLVKEQTGKNYTEIITNLRMKKAIELLNSTDLYIYEIAEQVGYKNLNYFYRVFKKTYGVLPGERRSKGVNN